MRTLADIERDQRVLKIAVNALSGIVVALSVALFVVLALTEIGNLPPGAG